MNRSLRLHALLALGLAAGVPAAACSSSGTSTSSTTSSSSTGSTSTTSSGQGGASSSSSGTMSSSGGGSGGASSSSGSGGGGGSPVSFACPTNLPKKAYGVCNGAANLTADETWTPANVYIVDGDLNTGTHHLTIQAGTVVCISHCQDPGMVDHAGKIIVSTGGSLDVQGTAQSHVLFTTGTTTPFYAGVAYEDIQGNVGSVKYLDMFHGGDSGDGKLLSTFRGGGTLDWQNVTFYKVLRNGAENLTKGGFTAQSSLRIASYEPNDSNGNPLPPSYYVDYPAFTIVPEGTGSVTATTLAVDASAPDAVKYVSVDHAAGAVFDSDAHFHKLSAGLVFGMMSETHLGGDTAKPNTWTFDAGVTLAFQTSGYLAVGDGSGFVMSNVVFNGTAQDPITLTSLAPNYTGMAKAVGDYAGLVFFQGNFDANVSKLDHVKLEYGGAQSALVSPYNCNDKMSGVGAEIVFSGASGNTTYPGPAITHCDFSKSAGMAIRAENQGTGATVGNDYADPKLGNTFNGFTNPPATFPSTCN